ncbi:MAG TPA: MBL fold metallo-hydrolase [Casimicrobiaceae bacterium]|nr:MBL fold metallo-hydrolase [Casimicrobiaceae bacterium]
MRLGFHGAARGVTGSCYLLEAAGRRILVDCGFFQGPREIADDNRDAFGFDPREIDFLLLTHAHLDHCGRIPLLAKAGFRGEIVATPATRELARLVLLDAAHLQEEDARRSDRRAQRRGGEAEGPLYTIDEAAWSFDRFGRSAAYGERLVLDEGIAVTFLDAGHILGSASLVVEATESAARRTIVFSGDVGSPGHPILRDPTPPPHADVLVMESTYGDRCHRSLAESVEELWQAIADTLARGGNAIIPAFALERSQEILYFLRQGIEQNRLPRTLPVFLDSPMAISATEIMRRHPECFDAEALALFARHESIAPPGLRFSRETADSIALNRITAGAVIIAGSGMCTGGRVRHHLRHHLWREASSVIFVGFAAEGTLAREIIDGATTVQLLGEPVRVRAHVHTINGFSAHADQRELLAWQASAAAARTFLVHGEPRRGMKSLADLLEARGGDVTMPQMNAAYALG